MANKEGDIYACMRSIACAASAVLALQGIFHHEVTMANSTNILTDLTITVGLRVTAYNM